MTKAGLCWSAIKPLTIVFNVMALVFSLVIAFMAVFTDAGARLLLLVPFLFLFIGGLLPLLMLSMPAMALVFSLVIAFMAVFTDAGARLLLLVPFLFLFIGGLLPLLMLSMPARGILEIGRQERELGFSFAEEMASRGATGTSLVDDDWFIEISNARVVAFRRDYLKKVTPPRLPQEGHGARGQ